jgi:hypothetical protein
MVKFKNILNMGRGGVEWHGWKHDFFHGPGSHLRGLSLSLSLFLSLSWSAKRRTIGQSP